MYVSPRWKGQIINFVLTLSQTKISGVITPSGGQKKPKFVLIDRESILGKENSSDSLLTNILYHDWADKNETISETSQSEGNKASNRQGRPLQRKKEE